MTEKDKQLFTEAMKLSRGMLKKKERRCSP